MSPCRVRGTKNWPKRCRLNSNGSSFEVKIYIAPAQQKRLRAQVEKLIFSLKNASGEWQAATIGSKSMRDSSDTFLHIHSTVCTDILRHSPPRCSSPREFGRSRTRPSWSWQTGRSCSSCRPVRRTVGQSVRLTHHVQIRAHRYRKNAPPVPKASIVLVSSKHLPSWR